MTRPTLETVLAAASAACRRKNALRDAPDAPRGMVDGERPLVAGSGNRPAEGGKDCHSRESVLQKAAEQWLSLHNIEYLHLSPRASGKKGWPGLTFAVAGLACAVEFKSATGQLSRDQIECMGNLAGNGWRVAVCRELSEFVAWVRNQRHVENRR